MTAYAASLELFKVNCLCASPQEMKKDINGKSNPASKYSKNFRFKLWVLKVCKNIFRRAYCTPSTCNKCRSYLLRHTQGEHISEKTLYFIDYTSNFRRNFRLYKTTNYSSTLVPLLHFRLGFKWLCCLWCLNLISESFGLVIYNHWKAVYDDCCTFNSGPSLFTVTVVSLRLKI